MIPLSRTPGLTLRRRAGAQESAPRPEILALLLPAFALGLAGCTDDEPTGPNEPSTVELIREATTPYQDVDAAVADGYAEASPCIASPAGAMGFHYVSGPLVDATVDPEAPEALLYVPGQGGGLTLVGVEYVVLADAWDAANDGPPTLDQQAFDDHRAPEARHGLPFPHYDLHVWAWQENPSGLYAPFNPTISCE